MLCQPSEEVRTKYCPPRGWQVVHSEFEDLLCRWWSMQVRESTLTLNCRAYVTRSPKQGYQCPTKDSYPPKYKNRLLHTRTKLHKVPILVLENITCFWWDFSLHSISWKHMNYRWIYYFYMLWKRIQSWIEVILLDPICDREPSGYRGLPAVVTRVEWLPFSRTPSKWLHYCTLLARVQGLSSHVTPWSLSHLRKKMDEEISFLLSTLKFWMCSGSLKRECSHIA